MSSIKSYLLYHQGLQKHTALSSFQAHHHCFDLVMLHQRRRWWCVRTFTPCVLCCFSFVTDDSPCLLSLTPPSERYHHACQTILRRCKVKLSFFAPSFCSTGSTPLFFLLYHLHIYKDLSDTSFYVFFCERCYEGVPISIPFQYFRPPRGGANIETQHYTTVHVCNSCYFCITIKIKNILS